MSNKLLFVFLFFLTVNSASFAFTCDDDATASTAAAKPEGIFSPRFGVVAKFSTLGVGGDVGMSLTPLANIRIGTSGLRVTEGFRSNGIRYNATLHYSSVEALVDITPFRDWFHISPGVLFYNDNNITAIAHVPGGQNFDLGSVSLRSSPVDPVHGTGKLTVRKSAPMLTFGFGNPIPHHSRFTIFHDFGVVFQGVPKTTLNLAGTVCDPVTGLLCRNVATDPTAQAQIVAEQNRINKDTSIMRFYPFASIGLGIRF